MSKRMHFIAGLPRSGSTLLAAILQQNPLFHAGMTSPVSSLFEAVISQLSAGSEFALVVNEEKRRALLSGLFDSYYKDQADKQVVFDTNRNWCARLAALNSLFPESKVICCVRNVAWIMDSLERQYQKYPFENTLLFNNPAERNTVFSRIDTLGQRDRLVGFAWCALKEAVYGPHASSLLLVDYELLTRSPSDVIRLVYQFIDEPLFDHDFNHIQYNASDFDHNLGLPDLHTVGAKVKSNDRKTILPPDLFNSYADMSFWLDLKNSEANIIAPEK